jgi:hypothetical protein
MIDALILRERFEAARLEAVALTDRYRELSPDRPERLALWEHAMQQTETARQLLEAWLRSERSAATIHERELALV